MPNQNITDYEVKKLYEEDGLSIAKIVQKTSLSKWKVRNILEKVGANIRAHGRIEPSNEKYICQLYQDGKNMKEITKITGDSDYIVFRTLHENNIEIRKLGTEIDEEYVYNLYVNEEKSLKDISNILGIRNFKRIISILDKYNVKNRRRKYQLDENIFKEIDTPEKAYMLGFIYADGSVHNNVLGIAQSGDEHKILYKFREILKTNKPIYDVKIKQENKHKYKKKPYSLSITSKFIIKDLERWGIVQNKTFLIKFPKQLDSKLTRHFIRGYFDGDGYFNIRKNRKATGFWSLCSHKNFCKDIQKQLKKHNIIGNIYQNKRGKNSWELRVGKFSEISKLYQFLYFDSKELFILRKHDSFMELFNRK